MTPVSVPGGSSRAPETVRDKPLEIRFLDEARVGQQGTLTRIWAKRATRPQAACDTRSADIFGAVCRGAAAGLVMPFARAVVPGAHAGLVLDGAGWHGGNALVIPDDFSLVLLPPYSPELNPVEKTSGSISGPNARPPDCRL